MSSSVTRKVAAAGLERISRDPQIEMVPHTAELTASALKLFAARSDKDWSLTDCLSFIVMEQRNIQDALTADNHFEQAGFRAILARTVPPS